MNKQSQQSRKCIEEVLKDNLKEISMKNEKIFIRYFPQVVWRHEPISFSGQTHYSDVGSQNFCSSRCENGSHNFRIALIFGIDSSAFLSRSKDRMNFWPEIPNLNANMQSEPSLDTSTLWFSNNYHSFFTIYISSTLLNNTEGKKIDKKIVHFFILSDSYHMRYVLG